MRDGKDPTKSASKRGSRRSTRAGGELAALERIRSLLPEPSGDEVWLGDDAAVLDSFEGPLLLATDLVVAGVHAELDLVGVDDLGWKALTANASDIAAMGGWALRAVVGVAGPTSTELDELYAGLGAAADHYGCPIVGGDLSNAKGLVVSVAIVGTTRGHPPILRSGAYPGDTLFVTGPLGASAAGLAVLRSASRTGLADRSQAAELASAHRRPLARLAEGQAARDAGATAMIDVSDGLGIDLDRVARASGVGVRLGRLPIADGAMPRDALAGGEDYELVFSAPDAGRVEAAFASAGLRPPIAIGSCTADLEERRLGSERLDLDGWEHSWR